MPNIDYHRLTVVDVVNETADTKSFVLDIPPDLEATFSYAAGQFCTFRATIEGEPVVRCYSMSSSQDVGDKFMTTVKRVPGGLMSNWMNDVLGSGNTIEVMRPTGLFVLRPREVPIVAFAGGSGITPILSIIKSALATTIRPIRLIYANRSKDAIIFGEVLEDLRERSNGRFTIHHHLDEQNGLLDPASCVTLVGDRPSADFYVCGPGPYMETVEVGLEIIGISPTQLFVERFVVPDDVPTLTERSATETLIFKAARRKISVAYHAGETILESARRAGLSPPFSCESGSCATCMAHLDEGSATMRVNNALSPDEVDEGWVLTCQAIPSSQIVVVNYDA